MSGRREFPHCQDEPLAVRATPADWALARAELSARGTVVLYARPSDWAAEPDDERPVRERLGQDWSRYLELAHPEVALRFLFSRRLLTSVGAEVVGGSPEALEVRYGPTGRPYLRGREDIDISVSHTDGLTVVGMTTRGLVGVDVRRADHPLDESRLASHVCTPYELMSLTALPAAERNATLLQLLTLKEAYRKAVGQSARFRFNEFGFGPDGEPVRMHRPDGTSGPGTEWAFRSFLVDGPHRISVAVYDAGLTAS
ncbi:MULTISPECIES: 4'-phosphopantetheinyl transferase family protein [unclassified Streptomyces]|uniref:4'-phosphopantetheinyl transferase family protein n=1 Tax=unclassified Streptomyces TaxID=2593676 RepID=UPI002E2D682B|nr:4'-phosphopantetheinyl transferase superfamily protein [Streptomyces sp. NBC_00223]